MVLTVQEYYSVYKFVEGKNNVMADVLSGNAAAVSEYSSVNIDDVKRKERCDVQ